MLEGRVGGKTVECTVKSTDMYGRSVAVCVERGDDVNEWMVRNGWAVAYRAYSKQYVPVSVRRPTSASPTRCWIGSLHPRPCRRLEGNARGEIDFFNARKTCVY